jgi:hypothetical protein
MSQYLVSVAGRLTEAVSRVMSKDAHGMAATILAAIIWPARRTICSRVQCWNRLGIFLLNEATIASRLSSAAFDSNLY